MKLYSKHSRLFKRDAEINGLDVGMNNMYGLLNQWSTINRPRGGFSNSMKHRWADDDMLGRGYLKMPVWIKSN